MEIYDIETMFAGWFIGNFKPSVVTTSAFEVGYKKYKKGDIEPNHYQILATEVTLIISGTARIGDQIVGPGNIVVIPPKEEAAFEAFTEVSLVAIKFPSIPSDKVIA